RSSADMTIYVLNENREITVDAECRTLNIYNENRELIISAELRVLEIIHEDRTLSSKEAA
ncbi:hypothetical protein BSN82_17175, partial [Acinetobacter baylyi]|uniref:hypothetical protein n=1 Tax=Acinetobacter baylyi TaxID=202950 RepID=UPI001C085476